MMNPIAFLSTLKEKRRVRQEAAKHAHFLYGHIIKSARNHALYAYEDGLIDDADTRLESLSLHLFFFYERAYHEAELSLIADEMANLVTMDMENNLRELGAGDMKIGKKVKNTMRLIYGRLDQYWGHFHQGQEEYSRNHEQASQAQIDCLRRNLFHKGGGQQDKTIHQFYLYIQAQQAFWQQNDAATMLAPSFHIPDLFSNLQR